MKAGRPEPEVERRTVTAPPSVSRVRVRYAETDKMGVVYYANYFVWFEVGRTDLLRASGWNYRDMETEGFGLPVIEAHCTYRESAKYDDDIDVRTTGEMLSPVRVKFSYEVVRAADAVTLAKGLANGLPMGALLAGERAAPGFVPGDHGSTFGGNPVAAAAAAAVVEAIDDELLEHVRSRGAELVAGLAPLPGVRLVRGRGLLLGIELDRPAGAVVDACRERGLLVLSAGPDVLRLTPPLVVAAAEVEQALAVIGEVLSA